MIPLPHSFTTALRRILPSMVYSLTHSLFLLLIPPFQTEVEHLVDPQQREVQPNLLRGRSSHLRGLSRVKVLSGCKMENLS